MELEIDGEVYKINIIRKNNKNTYLRVKEDLNIYVTTNYFTTSYEIKRFINNNVEDIKKMIDIRKEKNKKNDNFYLLGKNYNVIICKNFKAPFIDEDKIYVKTKKELNKIYKEYSDKIFNERLKVNYNKFEENIPYPILKIRKMKSKWGYNCKSKNIVMLNSELIKYSVSEIDYVIIHELCHFLEFNHSKRFWEYVKKYKNDYKENKKVLKEQ